MLGALSLISLLPHFPFPIPPFVPREAYSRDRMASRRISRVLIKFRSYPPQQLRLCHLVQEYATQMDYFKVSMQGLQVYNSVKLTYQ